MNLKNMRKRQLSLLIYLKTEISIILIELLLVNS